jgi:putative NIF3 family GTP cyclohydrolase 1 type 2
MNWRILHLVAIMLSLSVITFGQQQGHKVLTAEQVIDLIKSKVNCSWSEKTVDTFKSGNPGDKVTGIAVCMFADMKALRQAVADNCNLIIVHEPSFYSHLDETGALLNDPVYTDKVKYINDHKLIIWRFHDHIHKMNPDGIYMGMINKLGWEKYRLDGSLKKFSFDQVRLSELISQLKAKFPGSSLRVVGNPDMMVKYVSLAVGAPGFATHLKMLQDDKTDVLVAGEVPEWETYQYVCDAQQQGKNKAVIFLGHTNSEEAGMEYCTGWLKEFIPQDLKIQYIKNGSVYTAY